MKKAILIEVDLGTSKHTSNPLIKTRLESEAKKVKHIKLEEVMGKLEQAAKKRENLQRKRGEKLKTLSKKNAEKIMRRHSCAEVEIKKQKDKVTEELEEASQRRRKRINSMVGKLRAGHEKVAEVHNKHKERKKNESQELKKKLEDKLESAESQREKIKDKMIKRLDDHNTEVTRRVKEVRVKKKDQPSTDECYVCDNTEAANKQKSMHKEQMEVEKK